MPTEDDKPGGLGTNEGNDDKPILNLKGQGGDGDGKGAGDKSGGWEWAEGVAGAGDRPDYLLDKYANVGAQAEAYVESQKAMGAFTGAPETYEIKIADDLKEANIGIDASSGAYKALSELCQGLKMNQDGHDKLVDSYLRVWAAEQTTNTTAEVEALGTDGPAIVASVESFANARMGDEQLGDLAKIGKTAAGLRLSHWFIGELQKAQDTKQPVNPLGENAGAGAGAGGVGGMSDVEKKTELDVLIADERYAKDAPGYRAKVDARAKELYPE